jgi:hypothetical protein
MEFTITERFHIRNIVFSEQQKEQVKIYYESILNGFNKNNINLHNITEKIIQSSLIREKEDLHELMSSLFNNLKQELTRENKKFFEDLKEHNKKPDFETKFKHVINKVKNNFKSIIKLKDESSRLKTCYESEPLVVHKSLQKSCFPQPHFNKDKEFVEKHDKLITRFQKDLMKLSIDHLENKANKLEQDNLDIKTRLTEEFNDLVYLKSTFNLKCSTPDEFFKEIHEQASELVKKQLIEKDAKLKRLIDKKQEENKDQTMNQIQMESKDSEIISSDKKIENKSKIHKNHNNNNDNKTSNNSRSRSGSKINNKKQKDKVKFNKDPKDHHNINPNQQQPKPQRDKFRQNQDSRQDESDSHHAPTQQHRQNNNNTNNYQNFHTRGNSRKKD